MSNFISCKGCTYENHPQKCHPEQGCYEDKIAYFENMVKQVKHEQDIDNFVELTTAKENTEDTYIFDAGTVEGPVNPAIEKIRAQPFFSKYKLRVKRIDRFKIYHSPPLSTFTMEDWELQRDSAEYWKNNPRVRNRVNAAQNIVYSAEQIQRRNAAAQNIHPTGILGEKHRLAQDAFNKNRRAMVDNMINHGVGFIKINSINPTEVIKPMTKLKCDKCTKNEGRIRTEKGFGDYGPECATCLNNPTFGDNFDPMPIQWPPEEGQDVWCISARGDVYDTPYDTNMRNWVNLVNVYPTEELANTAVETLLKARNLPNDEKD